MNKLINKPNIVFYHQFCSDGFGAAYSAWKKLGDTSDYIPLSFKNGFSINDLPDITDKNIYILDFSFEPELYNEVLAKAKSVNLLDHHASAYKKLCGCKGCFFDLTRSGAMIAWQYFNPDIEPPRFIRYIQDGDLWKFKYPETKSFYRMISTIEESFEAWSQLEDDKFLDEKLYLGTQLESFYQRQLKDLEREAKPVSILGIDGIMVNAPGIFVSDIGAILAKKSNTFSLIWHDRAHDVKCSLRSVEGFDCSKIAEHFGGGGHPQSASFSVNKLQDLLNIIDQNKK